MRYLNFRLQNMKFTFEKQDGGKLAFLDIIISNENDNFCTSASRKKIHQLVSTLTLPALPLFHIRLDWLKLWFTVLSELVVLETFLIKKKKLKICYWRIYTHLI